MAFFVGKAFVFDGLRAFVKPYVAKAFVKEVSDGFVPRRAWEDVSLRIDRDEPVASGARFIAQAARNGVVDAYGNGRIPMEFESGLCGFFSDGVDRFSDFFVWDKERVGLRASFCWDEEIEGHPDASEFFAQRRQIGERIDVEACGGRICLDANAGVSEIFYAFDGLFP